MLVQGFLLGQVALDKHLLAPVAVEAVEHVLHLFARREQHQSAAGAFHQRRQITNDRRRVRRSVPWVGLEVWHPQHAGVSVMKRAGHHGGNGLFRQAGAHAEAVKGAQGRQRGRGYQAAVGDVPQVAAQHFSGEDRTGVDLDIEQRTAFRQRQPTGHGRVVFRVFDGEGGPQLPIALGTRQQAAEQGVPLFGLVAGDADIDLAIHAFLEQVRQAREQVGEA